MQRRTGVHEDFGLMLKYQREKKGWSLYELSQKTERALPNGTIQRGLSPSYISRLENGDRNGPTVQVALLLAETLDIDIIELLRLAEGKQGKHNEKEFGEMVLTESFQFQGNPVTREQKEMLVQIAELITGEPWDDSDKILKNTAILGQLIVRLQDLPK